MNFGLKVEVKLTSNTLKTFNVELVEYIFSLNREKTYWFKSNKYVAHRPNFTRSLYTSRAVTIYLQPVFIKGAQIGVK